MKDLVLSDVYQDQLRVTADRAWDELSLDFETLDGDEVQLMFDLDSDEARALRDFLVEHVGPSEPAATPTNSTPAKTGPLASLWRRLFGGES